MKFSDSPAHSHATEQSSQESCCHVAADDIMPNVSWIHQRLLLSFPDAIIQVEDTRGDDQHLAVTIRAADFSGKTMIACHKMVYAALDQMRHNRIHAMSLKTIR